MEAKEITESEVVEMEVELQVYDKVSADVDAAMERCANIILCYDTAADITLSKSWIFQNLNKLNPIIKQAGKLGKAEALNFTRAMTAKEKELLGKVAKQIEIHSAPIKLIEDAEAKKVADEEAKIKAEEERMEIQRRAEHDGALLKLAAEQETLRIKQEAFDRKERDARIAEEATKKAYENAQYDATVAENHRIADVQRAKDEAADEAQEKERAVMEEQRIAREKKEADRIADVRRSKDKKHRSTVHRAIYKSLISVVVNGQWDKGKLGEHLAKNVTQALIDQKIPHVVIQY